MLSFFETRDADGHYATDGQSHADALNEAARRGCSNLLFSFLLQQHNNTTTQQHNTQHTTQHTTHNTQHTTHNTQHTTNTQHNNTATQQHNNTTTQQHNNTTNAPFGQHSSAELDVRVELNRCQSWSLAVALLFLVVVILVILASAFHFCSWRWCAPFCCDDWGGCHDCCCFCFSFCFCCSHRCPTAPPLPSGRWRSTDTPLLAAHAHPRCQDACPMAISPPWERPFLHDGREHGLVAGQQALHIGEPVAAQHDEEVRGVEPLLVQEAPNAAAVAPLGTRTAWMARPRSPLWTQRQFFD